MLLQTVQQKVLKLAVNVGAMLLVFVAVIAMLNGVLGFFGGFDGIEYLGWEIIH
jgi:CNT family concentrative nucleoside transporter